MTRHLRLPLILAAALCVASCRAPDVPITRAAAEPDLLELTAVAPPGAPPGTCWGKTVEPAVTKAVVVDVLVQPAQISSTGEVQSPPIYRKETQQQILKPKLESWFQTPCAADLTPGFVASVQRALAARGHFTGTITGVMDARTRAAIRSYQAPEGLDSGILSVAAAQKMGLWTVAREQLVEEG